MICLPFYYDDVQKLKSYGKLKHSSKECDQVSVTHNFQMFNEGIMSCPTFLSLPVISRRWKPVAARAQRH